MTLALALAMVLVAGCNFGQRARENVLLPAIQMSLPNIETDALRGVFELPDPEKATSILHIDSMVDGLMKDHPHSSTAALWPFVEGLINKGIAARIVDGTLSEQSAVSFFHRNEQFGLALDKLFAKVAPE